jgi:hypothetical protein
MVLRAGKRRGGNLTPLECHVEAVELRKTDSAGAVVLEALRARLRVHSQQRRCLRPTAAGAVLQRCRRSRSRAGALAC